MNALCAIAAVVTRALFFAFALAAGCVHAAVAVETSRLLLAGQESAVDVYEPAASARGFAVIAHGFARSRAQHVVLATRLAEAGFIVAVPDLPHWAQHEANADAIVAVVDAIVAARGLDTLPVVLIGTSAGGLASLLATDRVPRLALWVGLDPVDTLGQSRQAARKLNAPAMVLRAPAGACNVGGSARRIAARLPSWRVERRIDDASHCDFEDTTNWRCESICGVADASRQASIVAQTVKAARDAVPD
jgi:alpha-beta hydrolase superfamily lysophospholipase